MKYVLFIFFFFIAATYAPESSARSIHSFRESESIITIAQFMYDVSEDLSVSYLLSDKKLNIKEPSQCVLVTAEDVLSDVEASIKKVLRFYPDEELPLEEALVDLEDYLDHRLFKKCNLGTMNSFAQGSSTTYYFDQSNKIHLRLDKVFQSPE